MTTVTFEMTTPADIPALQRVLDETHLFPSGMLPDMLAPMLAGDSPARWLTCQRDGVAIGLCFAEPEELTDGTWNMRALALHPQYQGQGLGAALTRALEDQLRAEGQRLIIVDTSGTDDFAQTRGFYSHVGYSQVACIPDYWAKGDDKVVFSKPL